MFTENLGLSGTGLNPIGMTSLNLNNHFRLWHRYHYHPHFTNEDPGLEDFSNVLKVAECKATKLQLRSVWQKTHPASLAAKAILTR